MGKNPKSKVIIATSPKKGVIRHKKIKQTRGPRCKLSYKVI